MPTFMSIGGNCEVAYQIRRHTGDEAALMFDWLITPIESCGVLWSDDAAWLQPGNWDIAADGCRVRDRATGLEFQHEFETLGPDSVIVDESKVEGHLDAARAKFRHLKQKTLDVMASCDQLYLLRREFWADTAVAAANAAAIVETYERLNPNLRVVVVSSTADLNEQFDDRRMILQTNPTEAWSGDDAAWDRIFALIDAWREGFRA